MFTITVPARGGGAGKAHPNAGSRGGPLPGRAAPGRSPRPPGGRGPCGPVPGRGGGGCVGLGPRRPPPPLPRPGLRRPPPAPFSRPQTGAGGPGASRRQRGAAGLSKRGGGMKGDAAGGRAGCLPQTGFGRPGGGRGRGRGRYRSFRC